MAFPSWLISSQIVFSPAPGGPNRMIDLPLITKTTICLRMKELIRILLIRVYSAEEANPVLGGNPSVPNRDQIDSQMCSRSLQPHQSTRRSSSFSKPLLASMLSLLVSVPPPGPRIWAMFSKSQDCERQGQNREDEYQWQHKWGQRVRYSVIGCW